MTTKAAIDQFLGQKSLAVVGASRNPQKFGSSIYRELKTKGYTVYPVNPQATEIQGDPCYPNLAALPQPVGGVVIITKPAQTEEIVRQAYAAGIHNVWLQQGAESQGAVDFCKQNGINLVAGECIFMFSKPIVWFHGIHRWINGAVGKLPK